MNKIFQDIHIKKTDMISSIADEFVERQIELQSICFYETYIIITFIKNQIEYTATIDYEKLARKSIIID
jgi:hypothetical protein